MKQTYWAATWKDFYVYEDIGDVELHCQEDSAEFPPMLYTEEGKADFICCHRKSRKDDPVKWDGNVTIYNGSVKKVANKKIPPTIPLAEVRWVRVSVEVRNSYTNIGQI